MGLSAFSTAELAAELQTREFPNEKGMLDSGLYQLAGGLSVRFAVDGAPARLNDEGEVELMAIVRGTGPYTGKLCLVGGGVGWTPDGKGSWEPESVKEALTRHFTTDLGTTAHPLSGDYSRPDYLAQDMAPRDDGSVKEDFCPNPNARHLVAARFVVGLENEPTQFGSTTLGGQEASDVRWFTERTMPGSEAFGYNHGETYARFFPIAGQYLGAAAIVR